MTSVLIYLTHECAIWRHKKYWMLEKSYMLYLVSQSFFNIGFKMESQPAVYQVVKLRESGPSGLAWKILNLQCSAK